MISYVDIHSHVEVTDCNVISHPTLSLCDDAIFDRTTPFWCGVHPCDADKMSIEEALKRLEKIKTMIVGVGEIGLDFLCKRENQKELFEAQLDFAKSNHFPVTIHAVKSYNEIVETLKRKGGERVVIHSFISHPVIAQHLMDVGCFLSYGGKSLLSKKSVDALRRMPFERLFLESDHEIGRQKTNIVAVYEQVAQIKGVTVEDLKQKIYENYLCLIG